jgi:hypothetical protein
VSSAARDQEREPIAGVRFIGVREQHLADGPRRRQQILARQQRQ